MTLLEIVLLLAIAAICGALGQALVGYSVGGCLTSIIVGVVGAYLGLWAARSFDLPTFFALNVGGNTFPVIWSILGAAVFSAVLGLLNRGATGRRY